MAWTSTLVAARGQDGNAPELEYLITSDGSASAGYGVAGAIQVWHRCIRGSYLQEIITKPGTGDVAPSAAYSVTIYDVDGVQIHQYTSRATDTNERESIPYDTGKIWKMNGPITIVFTDLGDSGDQVTVRLIFAK